MRKLFGIIFFLIAIVIGLGILAYFNSAYLLAEIISHKTRVPVSIESLDFYKEQFTIRDLQMANPKGARLPTALTVETIDVKAPYKHYIENPIVIDEIHLNNVYMNIQVYNKEQTKGNWHTIIENVQKENKSPLSIEREAIIKSLLLTNIKIDLILSNGELHHLSPIDKIEFKDVTTEKGIPIQEISEIIVQKMMQSVFLQKGLKAIIEAPVDIIKGIFPFLGQTSEAAE